MVTSIRCAHGVPFDVCPACAPPNAAARTPASSRRDDNEMEVDELPPWCDGLRFDPDGRVIVIRAKAVIGHGMAARVMTLDFAMEIDEANGIAEAIAKLSAHARKLEAVIDVPPAPTSNGHSA